MPRVGFEPTVPAFKRAKTVIALDRAATVIVTKSNNVHKIRFRRYSLQPVAEIHISTLIATWILVVYLLLSKLFP
jgi:hypothetical protein